MQDSSVVLVTAECRYVQGQIKIAVHA